MQEEEKMTLHDKSLNYFEQEEDLLLQFSNVLNFKI